MSPNESAANRKRGRVLGAVPIAVAGSIAVTMGLVTPAQATKSRESERTKEKAPETGPSDTADGAEGRGAATTVTSSIPIDTGTSPAQTAVASTPASYRVQSGDTISGIAARFGLSTASLLARNGLSWKSLIFPDQVLSLGGIAQTVSAAPSSPAAAATYTVVQGDTISGIAARFGVPPRSVLSANGLSSSSLIFPGQLITIPGMAAAASTTPVSAPAPIATAPAPHPTTVRPGRVVPLTEEMRANAQLIVRIGREEGVGDQGIVVALAAAAQESGLRNVRYGDRDSLGLFQQRPSTGWGTAEQVLDPERAIRAFYGGSGNPNLGRTRGLLDIPGWASMSVTHAAQAVQISAFPDAYAKWETSARAWLADIG